VRDEPYFPEEKPSERYDPLGILAGAAIELPSLPSYRSPSPLDLVDQGLLSDGRRTYAHPTVTEYTRAVERDPFAPSIEAPTDTATFALAALWSFRDPGSRVHWVFWAREAKEKTMTVIQAVLGE